VAEKQGDAASSIGYALEANSPNPFSQTSTINYSLLQESVVSLVVYNQLGQVVQTLVNSVVGAGPHQALFDGSQLPAGTYYYTLKAGNFVQTQSMVLEH
jgi:flagellar hook assembly protein FlgD